MIVLRKEAFDLLAKELKYTGLLIMAALIIFKIAFFKENLAVLLRNVLSLFWMFVLPGYFIMLYWAEKLDFMERFIIGIALSAGVIGISSYYIGLMGLNMRYHAFILPFLLILTGFIVFYNKKNNYSKEHK